MASAQNPHDPHIGKIIDGRYEILERVGEGGMGVVYKSRQVSIDRLIAIKMLNKQMAQDPTWVERFYNEARACSRLQHPNTIRMFDFGQTREGALFMTMEYLDGRSLRQAIADSAPMDPTRVLKILIQCCASLAEAHSLQIIHRDMKPDNVFLLDLAGSPDFVKVLDFSVAKLMQASSLKTQAGVVFGTPQYMSPEQGRGVPLDPRSDLYGLGILAFEMLTGQVPFDDHNPMSVLQKHIMDPIPALPAQLPGPVRSIVSRALAKEPRDRFPSAPEMLQACQQAMVQIAAPVPGMRGAALGGPPPPAPGYGGYSSPGTGNGASAPSARTVMLSDPSGGNPGSASGIAPAPRAAPSSAKTVMATGLDALGGAPPLSPPGPGAPMMSPIMTGGAPMPAGLAGGPQKTMMLEDTSGVVSFTGSGSAPRPRFDYSGVQTGLSRPGTRSTGGPSFLFWAISLTSGVVIGVLAYLLLLRFTR